MDKKFKSLIKHCRSLMIVMAALSLLIFSLAGCAGNGRVTPSPTPNPNNLTGQGQNYMGGAPGTNMGTTPGPNTNLGLPDTTRLGTAPSPLPTTSPAAGTGNPGIGNNLGAGINGTGNAGIGNNAGASLNNQLGFDKQKADNIRNQLVNMDGVNNCNTIVNGNTALVGYTPANTAANINAMRNTITNKVKQIDPSITNVVVSDSADMMNQMTQLTNDITNNRPMNELKTRFSQLVNSIMAPAR